MSLGEAATRIPDFTDRGQRRGRDRERMENLEDSRDPFLLGQEQLERSPTRVAKIRRPSPTQLVLDTAPVSHHEQSRDREKDEYETCGYPSPRVSGRGAPIG